MDSAVNAVASSCEVQSSDQSGLIMMMFSVTVVPMLRMMRRKLS